MTVSDLSVGIVIRTKDRPVLLLRALLSVFRQTCRKWELVVVNDGGSPESVRQVLDMASRLPGADQRIRVKDLPLSRGVAGAANAGLDLLQTDLAALHDDDDAWPETFLAESVAAFSAQRVLYPTLTLVAAPVIRIEERLGISTHHRDITEVSRRPFEPYPPVGLISLPDVLVHNLFPPIALLWDLASLRQVGLFREDLPVLEDWDANRKLLLLGEGYQRGGAAARYHVRVPDSRADAAYANTITAQRELHLQTRQRLLNEWLRADLAAGRMGAGAYTAWLVQRQGPDDTTRAILRELRQGGLLRDGKALARGLRDWWRRRRSGGGA